MIIYKTTNLIDNKFYIGMDTRNNPDYFGSGVWLKRAIEKYGKENFKKEILEYCDDIEHLKERERWWIKEMNCRQRSDCYNIGEGGDGGDNITFNPNKKEFISKMKIINSTNNGMSGKKHKTSTREILLEKAKDRFNLKWYIDRYGETVGKQMYMERCENIRNSRKGPDNHEFRHIDKNALIEFINDNPECLLKDVASNFNVGTTCIYGKFRYFFNCKNLKEVKVYLKKKQLGKMD